MLPTGTSPQPGHSNSLLAVEPFPLPTSTASTQDQASIISYVGYCNSLLTGLPASSPALLQSILHTAARGATSKTHKFFLLQVLHQLPATLRVRSTPLTFTAGRWAGGGSSQPLHVSAALHSLTDALCPLHTNICSSSRPQDYQPVLQHAFLVPFPYPKDRRLTATTCSLRNPNHSLKLLLICLPIYPWELSSGQQGLYLTCSPPGWWQELTGHCLLNEHACFWFYIFLKVVKHSIAWLYHFLPPIVSFLCYT